MTSDSHDQRNPTRSDQNDKALLESLKPLIGRCLALNHELNNYLAGIVGYCELLLNEEEQLSEDQKQMIREIRKCAKMISKHIEAMAREKTALAEITDLRSFMEALKSEDEGSD